jgi:hypothetical protein
MKRQWYIVLTELTHEIYGSGNEHDYNELTQLDNLSLSFSFLCSLLDWNLIES